MSSTHASPKADRYAIFLLVGGGSDDYSSSPEEYLEDFEMAPWLETWKPLSHSMKVDLPEFPSAKVQKDLRELIVVVQSSVKESEIKAAGNALQFQGVGLEAMTVQFEKASLARTWIRKTGLFQRGRGDKKPDLKIEQTVVANFDPTQELCTLLNDLSTDRDLQFSRLGIKVKTDIMHFHDGIFDNLKSLGIACLEEIKEKISHFGSIPVSLFLEYVFVTEVKLKAFLAAELHKRLRKVFNENFRLETGKPWLKILVETSCKTPVD